MSTRRMHVNALRAVARRLPSESKEQEALFSAADFLENEAQNLAMAESVSTMEPMIPVRSVSELIASLTSRIVTLESNSISLAGVERYVLQMIEQHGKGDKDGK